MQQNTYRSEEDNNPAVRTYKWYAEGDARVEVSLMHQTALLTLRKGDLVKRETMPLRYAPVNNSIYEITALRASDERRLERAVEQLFGNL